MVDLLTRLSGVKSSGDGWMARCPAHEDHYPSLSIGRGDDGRWLLKCHAGCAIDAILLALDLQRRDLLPDTGDGSAGRREVAVYDYVTFEVVRYEPKSFLQRRPDGHGGYLWNTKGVAPRLYRQGDLRGRESVIVAEGEKDVDRLWELGLPATCNAGGAGKWKSAHTDQLVVAGIQRVVVLPDADEAGLAHGRAVTQACAGSNIAVKVLTLPDGSKDVSAYLDAGHNKAALIELLEAAPPYTPVADLPRGWHRLSNVDATAAAGPPVVARGVAWQGRVTLLHAREKAGKSTLVGAVVAAVTQGAPFLEMPTRKGSVVWFGEEHSGEVKKRLVQWDADCARVIFGNRLDKSREDATSLERLVNQEKPVLVVIDPLILLASEMGIRDLHGAGELGPILARLVALARDSDAAIVILHHDRKNPSTTSTTGDEFSEYRDSTSIGAMADMIVALSREKAVAQTARRLTLKGRWFEPTLVVTLEPKGYTLHKTTDDSATPGDTTTTLALPVRPPLNERLLLYLLRSDPQARPGTTMISRELNCGSGGRKFKALKATLDDLVDVGFIDHDQRPGTTETKHQGYALTAHGRAEAEALERLLPLAHRGGGSSEVVTGQTSTSTNGK